ncbi:hypothetical protein N1851_034497 [Merluccius polli]|uniref:Uncharacterized protein n=1 Tax=Merluccius polli TaxID=89951 RepID=A0AA47NNH5_MERPO|nr:hypothetical protein N1851_034497 [Merluccius polli]
MNDILVEYKPSRALRSTDLGQIVKPRVQTKHGEAAFSCYAAQNWNKLPAELKSAPTFSFCSGDDYRYIPVDAPQRDASYSLRQTSLFTFSGDKLDLLFCTIWPAKEKSISHATVVAGVPKYLRAMWAMVKVHRGRSAAERLRRGHRC